MEETGQEISIATYRILTSQTYNKIHQVEGTKELHQSRV
jgi:hypothetical protein